MVPSNPILTARKLNGSIEKSGSQDKMTSIIEVEMFYKYVVSKPVKKKYNWK